MWSSLPLFPHFSSVPSIPPPRLSVCGLRERVRWAVGGGGASPEIMVLYRCRPYVVNLLPCLARVCRRPEEAVQETLAPAMAKMAPVLMGFTTDVEIKVVMLV